MKTLEVLKGNTAAITMQKKAVDILEEIGFIDFLRERAQPVIINLGENPHVNSAQGMRSAGYFDCINDLLYFKERYIQPEFKDTNSIVPDYGASEDSIKKGYLTKEELDGIKSNQNSRQPI